jgi:hypothetical protein
VLPALRLKGSRNACKTRCKAGMELAACKTLATAGAARPALKHTSFSVCVTARSRSQRAASRQRAAARSGRSRPLESQGGAFDSAQPSHQ